VDGDECVLPAGGTALIQARAIPNSNNGGNGTGRSGGGPVTYDNLGNPIRRRTMTRKARRTNRGGFMSWKTTKTFNHSSDDQNDSYGILKTTEEDSGVYNYDRSWQSGAVAAAACRAAFITLIQLLYLAQ